MLLLLGAAWIRTAGIGYGLDLHDRERTFLDSVDETGMVGGVRDALRERDLHPREFLNRGPGGFLVFLAFDLPLVAWKARVEPGGFEGARLALERNPSALHLSHRLVSALCGVLSVALMVLFVGRLFDVRAGLLAGAVLAASYQHVRDSHFGRIDVMWALFTLAAVERASVLLTDPRTRNYAVAGALAGAAFAIKYFGVTTWMPLVVAHFFARARARERGVPVPHARLVLGLAAFPLGCLLLFPGIVTAWSDLVALLDRQTGALGSKGAGNVWRVLRDHSRDAFALGLGELAFACACAGLVLAWRRGPPGRFLLASLAAALLPLLIVQYSPLRFADAMLVLLTAPAGIALAAGLARLPSLARPIVLVLVLAPSLVRGIAFVRLLPRTDTRVEMLSAIRRLGVPPRDIQAVGVHQGMPSRGSLLPSPYRTYSQLVGSGRLKRALQGKGRNPESPARIQAFLADPTRFILWNDTSARKKPRGMREIAELLRARYREVLRLDGRNTPEVKLIDPVSAQFMPYARPWRMHRPGPVLVLYERIDTAPGDTAPDDDVPDDDVPDDDVPEDAAPAGN